MLGNHNLEHQDMLSSIYMHQLNEMTYNYGFHWMLAIARPTEPSR
jgi:hypothetical protein